MRAAAVALVLLAAVAGCMATREWSLNDRHFKGSLHESKDVTGLCGSTKSTAGYYRIQGSKNKNYFYWYFEAQNSPETAPVVLWMTGGPGCSSQLALLFENGPCTANADGSTTTPNPYSWNLNANIVFIDQPAGVGFSYGAAGDEDHNEAGVAEDMNSFLLDFFAGTPGLAGRELYIFGESYGGHYAPATAYRVSQTPQLNLKGLAVGNGLTDPLVQYEYYPELGYTWAQKKTGEPILSKTQYETMRAGWPLCKSKIAKCQNDTAECPAAQGFCNTLMVEPYEAHGMNPYDIRKKCGPNPLCYDTSNVTKFLTNPKTTERLGVAPGQKWQSCNYTVNAMFSADWMKDFQYTVPALLAKGVRVLIYAGDVDFICNWIGNKQWTLALDWPGHGAFNAAEDKPWSAAGAQAGMIRSADNFTFLQVYDAGHMVPHDKPAQAQVMLDEFLQGTI